jgi:hypothetical protein
MELNNVVDEVINGILNEIVDTEKDALVEGVQIIIEHNKILFLWDEDLQLVIYPLFNK